MFRSVPFRLRNTFQTKVVQKTKAYNLSSENRAFYEIMWENAVEPDR